MDVSGYSKASLEEIASLLSKWRDSKEKVWLLFSGASDESWVRKGSVISVLLTKFEIEWESKEKELFPYDVFITKISPNNGTMLLQQMIGDRLVICEEDLLQT